MSNFFINHSKIQAELKRFFSTAERSVKLLSYYVFWLGDFLGEIVNMYFLFYFLFSLKLN